VNAYYNPPANEIAFPAGILQPPFFSKDFPAAMNYGAIGMVMGHEVTHGFDDDGSKFDKDGRMQAWWPEEVRKRFDERTSCVVQQFNGYEVAPGLKVNGELTLGENIADIGGARLAFRAYKAAQASGKAGPAGMPNMSDDQLFFVSMAQSWCSVSSPEYEKMRVLSDPHSPNRFRVNGSLANVPEFAAAFGCAEGSPMRPKNACEVW
jgi:endothelin-converting enzyme/putative endopeptidase